MSARRYLLLGLFFLAVIGTLGYYTLFMTDFTLFGDQPKLVVRFPEASGVRDGDSVLVAGMRWGRVESVSYLPEADPELRIELVLRLDRPLELHEGYEILIEDATLLGGHNVTVEPGPPGAPLVPPDAVLVGAIRPNVLASVGKFFEGPNNRIEDIVAGLDELVREAREGRGLVGRALRDQEMADDLAAVLARAATALESLDRVARGLAAGEGTIGALLTERDLYDRLVSVSEQLDRVLGDAGELTRTLREGEGLLPRILNDPALADDVAGTLAELRGITQDLRGGKGTFGRLLTDDGIARDLETVVRGLAEGEGTIGALLRREELYDDLAVLLDDLAAISTALRTGQGSLGKLVMDDELYEDLRITVELLTRSLEEYREAAPITTFTSVLFGGI